MGTMFLTITRPKCRPDQCDECGYMCLVYSLVFSQSLLSLDLIEAFLAHWDKQISNTDEQVYIVCTV